MHSIRINNFDLLRLFAATQVALHHYFKHYQMEQYAEGFVAILRLFPGVPIFFFISGFLISKSFESNSVIKEYAFNRAVRIYPALIVCTLVSLLMVSLTGYLAASDVTLKDLSVWLLGQMTFVQFYNPDFLRGFGVGALNGSLWSIAVELQFYVLIPILYWVMGGFKSYGNAKLIVLILLFMVFHQFKFLHLENLEENMLIKLYGVTFLPWFYMFLLGILFQRNFKTIADYLAGKFIYLLPIYLLVTFISVEYFGAPIGNGIHPLLYLLLACLVFSAAYSYTTWSERLLNSNDVSYGIYIYHMPVLNLTLYLGFTGSWPVFIGGLVFTVSLAVASWFLLEKPIMKMKKRPLHSLK